MQDHKQSWGFVGSSSDENTDETPLRKSSRSRRDVTFALLPSSALHQLFSKSSLRPYVLEGEAHFVQNGVLLGRDNGLLFVIESNSPAFLPCSAMEVNAALH